MLGIIIYFNLFLALYYFIIKNYDKRACKRMDATSDVLEATKLRKHLISKRKRILIWWFVIAYLSIFLMNIIRNLISIQYDSSVLYVLVFIYTILAVVFYLELKRKAENGLYGNVSYQTVDEYLERTPSFYLYLRGFEDDIPFGSKEDLSGNDFRERIFAEAVEYGTNVPLCAVGMPKELDSPIGAYRVYADNQEWQAKVASLMQKAEKVFILINNSKSCMWEIEQAEAMKEKIVFIVDNPKKYSEVKAIFGETFGMPDDVQSCGMNFFFECGGQAIPFDNSLSGYMSILNLSLEEVEAMRLEERKEKLKEQNRNNLIKIFPMSIMALVIIFYISFLLASIIERLFL